MSPHVSFDIEELHHFLQWLSQVSVEVLMDSCNSAQAHASEHVFGERAHPTTKDRPDDRWHIKPSPMTFLELALAPSVIGRKVGLFW